MNLEQAQNWFLNFSERKRQIAFSITSVIAGGAILIGYSQMGPNAMNYAQAEEVFAKWATSPQDAVLYASMKEAMRNVPELQKKYEATIVQTLLNTDKLQDALSMAHSSLARVKDEVPFHAVYAQASLLIEQGNFQEALEKAVSLKEQMGPSFLKENKAGALLYMHNLLRIACLHQELKNRPGERAAWEELESILQLESKPAQSLLGNFTEREVNLIQYIAERKKAL